MIQLRNTAETEDAIRSCGRQTIMSKGIEERCRFTGFVKSGRLDTCSVGSHGGATNHTDIRNHLHVGGVCELTRLRVEGLTVEGGKETFVTANMEAGVVLLQVLDECLGGCQSCMTVSGANKGDIVGDADCRDHVTSSSLCGIDAWFYQETEEKCGQGISLSWAALRRDHVTDRSIWVEDEKVGIGGIRPVDEAPDRGKVRLFKNAFKHIGPVRFVIGISDV